MDLRAVKAARRTELAACATAAARNAQGLVHDAEVLAESGCAARACSLAALAVEECGKAAGLIALAMLSRKVRTRAPAGRMLEWHQLKQLGGLLIATVPPDMPGTGPKLAAMPAARAREILSTLNAPADEADRLKRRGLYVDMDRNGRIREPSEITAAEAASQLAQARQAAASASVLLGPQAQARIANPPAATIKFARALASELAQPGNGRTPWAASDAMLHALSALHEAADGAPVSVQTPASEAPGLNARPGPGSPFDNSGLSWWPETLARRPDSDSRQQRCHRNLAEKGVSKGFVPCCAGCGG